MIYRNRLIISVFLLFCNSFLFEINDFRAQGFSNEIPQLSSITELNNKKRLHISFNESLTKEKLSISQLEEYSWEVSGDEINKTGKGEGILNFVFQNPGQYIVSLIPSNVVHSSHEGSCNHALEPKQFEVIVLSTKFEFLFDQSSFLNPLKGGVDVSGNTMSIPVVFSSYDKKDTQIEGLKMITSGVNTSIEGALKNQKATLSQGFNTLNFSLNGIASVDTYIMFDFYYHDDLIATYYCPNKINK
jgi:hypothetical protein